jgi:hypothetical protein
MTTTRQKREIAAAGLIPSALAVAEAAQDAPHVQRFAARRLVERFTEAGAHKAARCPERALVDGNVNSIWPHRASLIWPHPGHDQWLPS